MISLFNYLNVFKYETYLIKKNMPTVPNKTHFFYDIFLSLLHFFLKLKPTKSKLTMSICKQFFFHITICGIQFWFPTYVERAMSFMFHYICMYNVLLGFETESRPLSLHIYEHQDITKLIVRESYRESRPLFILFFTKSS